MSHQRCKYCGRFFKSPCPYDEFCTAACSTDDRTDRELVARLRAENLEELKRLARLATEERSK
jgi:hypothetical protein